MNNKELTNSKFGKWGWSMILYTALLYYFWSGIGSDGLNLYPSAFAAMHGWDSNQLLGFATPAGIIAVFGGILFGRLVMKTGIRKMSGFALIVTGILYAVFGYVKTPMMYLVCLTAFVFVSMAFGLICTASLMGNWFPRKKGIALGWATMGAPICTATFVAIMSALYGMLGISKAHVVMGAVMILLGVVSFFWVKDEPSEVGAYPDNLPDGAEAYKAQLAEMAAYKSPFTVGRLLRDKDMWLISVGFGMLWMVTVGVVSQFVPRMVSVMAPSIGPDAAQKKALLMLTVAAVVGIAGSYFWGWLDQKIGTKLASVVYSLSYIVALLLLIFAKVEILTYVAIVFVGLGIGGLPYLCGHRVRRSRDRRTAEPDAVSGHLRVRAEGLRSRECAGISHRVPDPEGCLHHHGRCPVCFRRRLYDALSDLHRHRRGRTDPDPDGDRQLQGNEIISRVKNTILRWQGSSKG